MKNLKNKYARALLATPIMALLVTPMAAQTINESASRVSFKVGMAPALEQGRQERTASFLVGLEYSHPFWRGEFFFVGEWREFIATEHEATQFSPFDWDTANYREKTGYAPNGQRGYITAFTRNPNPDAVGIPNRIASDMRFDSVDMRRALLDGVTAKLAYRYRTDSLPLIGSIGLQGGLTLNYLTSREYASGAIHVLEFRDMSQNAANTGWTADNPNLDAPEYGRLHNEYFYEQNSRGKFVPGAFIGVRKLFNDTLFFEMNVSMLGHTEVNYVPYAYSGQPALIETSNKTKTVIEFIAGMRF